MASADYTNLVKLLIEKKASVGSRSAALQAPLHLAVKTGSLKAAQLLFSEYRASISTTDEDGWHSVRYAIEKRSLAMARTLLVRDRSLKTEDTEYTLELQRRDLHKAIELSAVDIVKFLLKKYPNVAQPAEGISRAADSLLHIAARNSNVKTIRFLINLDLSVNLKGSFGRTPPHVAAIRGDLDAIRELFTKDPDLEAVDDLGITPLLKAVERRGSPRRLRATPQPGRPC